MKVDQPGQPPAIGDHGWKWAGQHAVIEGSKEVNTAKKKRANCTKNRFLDPKSQAAQPIFDPC